MNTIFFRPVLNGLLWLLFFFSNISGVAIGNSAKDDIRRVDFLNFSYYPTLCNQEYAKEGIGRVVQVRKGEFNNENISYSVDGNKVIYGDLAGDNGYEAVVHNVCWLNGANFGLSEIHIYTLQNRKALLLANFHDYDTQRDYRRYSPKGELWGMAGTDVKIVGGNLIIEEAADGPHCCPESIVTLVYRWNGKQFVLGKRPQKRPFNR